MSRITYEDQSNITKFRNKDMLISYLLALRNGDGAFFQKVTFSNGDYIEYTGEK